MATTQTFGRGIMSLVWSLILAVGGGVFLWFVISIFTENSLIIYGISGGLFAIMTYMAIFSENIKFEITGSNFKYYKRAKLVNDLDLKEYTSGYRQKSSDGSVDDITLTLVNKKTEEVIQIDATPIGSRKFFEMYELIDVYAKHVAKLKTVKKGDRK